MKNRQKTKLRAIAGTLLVISGVTHVTQLYVYPPEGHVIGAALFGVVYFLIGIGIVAKRSLIMYWIGAGTIVRHPWIFPDELGTYSLNAFNLGGKK